MPRKRPWLEYYGVDDWGQGFFSVNSKGNVTAQIEGKGDVSVELVSVVEAALARGGRLPLVVRFPQILARKLTEIASAFEHAIKEFDYENRYQGVFPLKVNPRAEVVEEVVRAGSPHEFGLEVGSKAELLIAIAQSLAPSALLVCNGHKDEAFLKLALFARKLGKRAIVVIENPDEAVLLAKLVKRYGIAPELGIRVKLYSRGSGRWERAAGEDSKFGMTTTQLLTTIEFLKSHRLLSHLKMLHFHLGSQITNIKRIKNAIREAARVFAKATEHAPELSVLNVGGGLGVDYDGSQSSSISSANYTLQEYANDVVYTVKEICDSEEVAHPMLVTESGRAIAAYHSVLIIPVLKEFGRNDDAGSAREVELASDAPDPLRELFEIAGMIDAKNYREYFRDAIEMKEDLFNLFELGFCSLRERAKGEALFGRICERTLGFIESPKDLPDEYGLLLRRLASRYVCNFSIFQSLPDAWALEQLFPIMPIHRLNERPRYYGTIADITCDSDGVIERFVHPRARKDFLELHSSDGKPYLLGVFLVGAYQDVIGDYHNLFGMVDEAVVTVRSRDSFEIEELSLGDDVREVIESVHYDAGELTNKFFGCMGGELDDGLASAMKDTWESVLDGYTYLAARGPKSAASDSRSKAKSKKQNRR